MTLAAALYNIRVFAELEFAGKLLKGSLDFTFSFYAPYMWNKLPEDCRSAETLSSFESKLKTVMFATAFP